MQDFFENKLGIMTMDEYERKFLETLRYVSFIRDEMVKLRDYHPSTRIKFSLMILLDN
jgi:hypothetical protein